MRGIILFIVFFLLVGLSFSQVRLSGSVTHQEMSLDQVIVKVIENGKVLRTLAVSKKGRYETEIPFNKEYILTFSRPSMFPVSIAIDTRVKGDVTDVVYEVPLNMPMFYRFAGMDARPFNAVIGTIKKTGDDQLAFTFIPDPVVISVLEPYQLESERRFMAREQPYDGNDDASATTSVPVSDPQQDEVSSKPSVGASTDKQTKLQQPLKVPTNAGNYAKEETEMAIEAQQRHFERSESSKVLNREQQQQQRQIEQSAKLQNEQIQLETIGNEKRVKQELALTKEAEQIALSQARVAQQARLSQLGVNDKIGDVAKPINAQKTVKISDYTVSDGLWLSEERILVQENGATVEYKKQVYDWLLFEVISYTRNGEEIDENKYGKIKAMVRY